MCCFIKIAWFSESPFGVKTSIFLQTRDFSSLSYLFLSSSPFSLEMSIRWMLGIWNSSSSNFSLIFILCFIFLPYILGDCLAFTCDIIIKSNELLSSKITLEDESTLPCGPDDHVIKKASHTPLPYCG